MPKLGQDQDMEQGKIGATNFSFSGTRVDKLGATEYTLVTVTVDESGSVIDFKNNLVEMLKTVVEACRRSPRMDYILIRVLFFSSKYANGTLEVHGFKPLGEVNLDDYNRINPGGMTPLCDALFSAIGATNSYAEYLFSQDFSCNGISFCITDGEENSSISTCKMVKEEQEKSISGEILESNVSILIGINTDDTNTELERFKDDTGINNYLPAGDATPANLAKLAAFVSQSISSQSQALGSGGPSQNISLSI